MRSRPFVDRPRRLYTTVCESCSISEQLTFLLSKKTGNSPRDLRKQNRKYAEVEMNKLFVTSLFSFSITVN